MYHCLLKIDGDFAVDLFGELARAYLAAVNTRSQVIVLHNYSPVKKLCVPL